MSTTDRQRLVPEREPTLQEVRGLTALDLFERRLALGPGRPMLHARGVTLSAGDVDALSARFARALQERGVRAGDRVGLLLQNDPQFPVCQLGAWRIGAVTVPFNPMLRAAELEQQMRDVGCTALVCLDDFVEQALPAARAAKVGAVAVTSAGDLAAAGGRATGHAGAEPLLEWLDASGEAVPAPPAPGDLAVITFTSGTSGRAKGACQSHANIVWATHVFRDWVDLDAETVILGAAPIFHVTGQVAHLALGDLLGAPVVLDHRFQPTAQIAAATRHGATFLVCAATAYQALLASGLDAPPTLNRLVIGAQAVPPALVDQLEAWTGCYVQNIYGMTETTSPSHAVPPGVRAPVHGGTGALSIGVPVTGTESAVVDPESGKPLPVGEPGEIVVRGPQVVRGYWQRPDADAQAFRDGWLRTGDLGIVDEDGWFYVVDRIKDIINAAGFKVAPREVEEVILGLPGVLAAAVVGVPDEYRGETVKAYVVAKPGAVLTEAAVVEHCRSNLAAYKQPRIVEFADVLPMTASGKVLRRELRERGPDDGAGSGGGP